MATRPLSPAPHAATLAQVAAALDRVRFGAIQLTLHEGRVVQIDVTERQRLP
ncbi:YezD family protein [Sphingomonas baiyangensis]|uniref:DUF2292 domain-containing protein n=1 Tax=Sphingomonas baiyangensis TaxID=2572576 RepID=A0A4U1L1X4_9SPHN|nr:YezD family protein [Sphingomonas baiyangensis]TKD49945.1 DUF2292 domain-containing protein [Sphingomonas baiyangensis]